MDLAWTHANTQYLMHMVTAASIWRKLYLLCFEQEEKSSGGAGDTRNNLEDEEEGDEDGLCWTLA